MSRRRIAHIAILFLLSTPCLGQQIDCISVDQSGDVTFNWSASTDPLFAGYRILDEDDNEVFNSADINSTTATISGQVLTTDSEYRLIVDLTDASTVGGIAAAPIFLTTVDGESEAIAVNWQPGLAVGQQLDLSRSRNGDPYQDLSAVTANDLNFTDDLKVCHEDLSYQLSYDNGTCVSTSNILTSTINDEQAPDAPEVNLVAIDVLTDSLQLDWAPSMADDVLGYVIFQSDGPGSLQKQVVDTVVGAANTNHQIWVTDNWNDQYTYSIAALDTCKFDRPVIGEAYGLGPTGEEHSVVLLNPLNYAPADRTVILSWEAYQGWDPTSYEIWYWQDNGTVQEMVGSVGAGVFTYVVNDLEINTDYNFYVRARGVESDQISTSNAMHGIITVAGIPDTLVLQNVTVNPDGTVGFEVETDVASGTTYQLFRSTNINGGFSPVQSTVDQNGFQVLFDPDDPGATSDITYYYQVCAIDDWGAKTTCSNIASTYTGLNATVDDAALTTALSWQPNTNWDATGMVVTGIEIYRADDKGSDGELIDQLDPTDLSFADDLQDVDVTASEFCYYVVFVAGDQDTEVRSQSAQQCIVLEPRVWVPTGYALGGSSGVADFKPVSAFLTAEGYEFLVFNRWGEVVFQTDEPGQGWLPDAPPDVYSWKLRFKANDGTYINRSGRVTLVH